MSTRASPRKRLALFNDFSTLTYLKLYSFITHKKFGLMTWQNGNQHSEAADSPESLWPE